MIPQARSNSNPYQPHLYLVILYVLALATFRNAVALNLANVVIVRTCSRRFVVGMGGRFIKFPEEGP